MRGSVLVGQSGGPTAIINSNLTGTFRTAEEHGYQKVYGMRLGTQGSLDEQYVDLLDYIRNDLELELLKRTPSAFLSTCRYKLPEIHEDKEVSNKVFAPLDKLDIEAFVYIGSNDSMDTVRRFLDYVLLAGARRRFVGRPKTIDNDLAITDYAPGFGLVAKYTATSTKEVIRDTLDFSYRRRNMNITGIIGRNASWLASATALARQEDCDGPDLIYLPEMFFDIEASVERTTGLLEKKDVIVVMVSKDMRTVDGAYICELADGVYSKDTFGRIQVTSTASYPAGLVHECLDAKTRVVELSTLQRAVAYLMSRVDVDKAFAVGGTTVRAVDEGSSGVTIVIDRASDDPRQSAIGVYNVHRIANGEKLVPHSWINAAGDYVTDEFVNYVRPLIQGRYNPVIVAGLSRHPVMNQKNYGDYRI